MPPKIINTNIKIRQPTAQRNALKRTSMKILKLEVVSVKYFFTIKKEIATAASKAMTSDIFKTTEIIKADHASSLDKLLRRCSVAIKQKNKNAMESILRGRQKLH